MEEASTLLDVEEQYFDVDFDVRFNLCFDYFDCFGWDNESSSFFNSYFLSFYVFQQQHIYLMDSSTCVDQ